MPQQTIPNSAELAKKIRQRRTELNLTIEEAASRAGVGTMPQKLKKGVDFL